MTEMAAICEQADKPGLVVDGLSVSFGRRRVVWDVSMVARPGEITVVVGHNGAGKSTLLRGVSGLLPARCAAITVGGQDVSRARASGRARAGIALVPDGARGVFPDMTVAENLQLSSVCAKRMADGERVQGLAALVEELFPSVLVERRGQRASSLSGGQRQMLAIAAALARGPSVIMLDEPSLGLAPRLTEQVLGGVQDVVRRFGVSCVLVEQNVGVAMAIADALLVLKEGRIAARFPKSQVPSSAELWHLF